jgi:signal transduction histidine kinase
MEAAGYFFASEALTNVLKHAQASQAWIAFNLHPEGLQVAVRDNGCGFIVDETAVHGLCGLADRVEAWEATSTSPATPGRGTVTATLPIEAIIWPQCHGCPTCTPA